jgi:hypothetical protein
MCIVRSHSKPPLPAVNARTLPLPSSSLIALLATVVWVLPVGAEDKTNSKPAAQEKAPSNEVRKAIIPDDLLGDEHLREEFGVNQFTTPSIEAIFELLGTLGTLPYDKLQRSIPDKSPSDRIAVSLGLGALIADGFLVVQCEKIEHMEPVGRALLKHAKVLGAGTRVNRHSQSLLEHSVKGDWKVLREELAKTQFDVEAEMLQLRDVDIAHLVSLGGWLRAFEISTHAALLNYDPEKTRNLARRDIAEYYLINLETLHPKAQEQPIVQKLRRALEELMPLVDVPEGKALSLEEVKPLAAKATELTKIAAGGQ